MWYVSGNRDEEVIVNPNAYIIDRERPRQHVLLFPALASTVASATDWPNCKLKEVIWEEDHEAFPGHPGDAPAGGEARVASSFIKGYETLPVMIPARN